MSARKWIFLLGFFLIGMLQQGNAQCSVCTKTAEQMGEKPGKGLNAGILYLMTTPLIALGYVGFRWWKREKAIQDSSNL